MNIETIKNTYTNLLIVMQVASVVRNVRMTVNKLVCQQVRLYGSPLSSSWATKSTHSTKITLSCTNMMRHCNKHPNLTKTKLNKIETTDNFNKTIETLAEEECNTWTFRS